VAAVHDRNAMAIAAHPHYSPDLTPSDFYLFGDVKGLLRGESFGTGERLLSAVKWMTSLEQCLGTDGDYV
jgi:hypothetical protein